MTKRHDRRRVKIHINYDITEVADLLGVHKHTGQTMDRGRTSNNRREASSSHPR